MFLRHKHAYIEAQGDFLVVQGIVLTVSVLVVLINFFFDFVINIVDPRISRE